VFSSFNYCGHYSVFNFIIVACIEQVMLESFLQAQKVSVRNSLQRSFRKYLTFGEEHNQLLMHQLQGLIRDAEKYHQVSIHNTLIVQFITYMAWCGMVWHGVAWYGMVSASASN
jgi:hypothetical protein